MHRNILVKCYVVFRDCCFKWVTAYSGNVSQVADILYCCSFKAMLTLSAYPFSNSLKRFPELGFMHKLLVNVCKLGYDISAVDLGRFGVYVDVSIRKN